MGFIKKFATVADYGLTTAEAIGLMQRRPLLKYGIAVIKSASSIYHDRSVDNVSKEIGQNGISALCDIYGNVTGNHQLAAQVELAGKASLDAAVWGISETHVPQRRMHYTYNF